MWWVLGKRPSRIEGEIDVIYLCGNKGRWAWWVLGKRPSRMRGEIVVIYLCGNKGK